MLSTKKRDLSKLNPRAMKPGKCLMQLPPRGSMVASPEFDDLHDPPGKKTRVTPVVGIVGKSAVKQKQAAVQQPVEIVLTPNPIPFILERTRDELTHKPTYEVVSKRHVQAFLRAPSDGKLLKIVKIVDADGVEQEHHLERVKLIEYLNSYDEGKQAFVVSYDKSPGGFGRAYLDYGMGMTSTRKTVRDTAMAGLMVDFDFANAHFAILVAMCQKGNLACPLTAQYRDDRESIMLELQSELGVDRKLIKKLLISYIFGGSFSGFAAKNNIGKSEPKFCQDLRGELLHVADKIIDANPLLSKDTKDKTRKKQMKSDKLQVEIRATTAKIETAAADKKEALRVKLKKQKSQLSLLQHKIKNFDGTFLSIYLQEVEFRIMQSIVLELKQVGLCDLPSDRTIDMAYIYEYDGVKLLLENVSRFGGEAKVIALMERVAKEVCEVDMRLEVKPVVAAFDLSKYMTDEAVRDMPVCTSAEMDLATGVMNARVNRLGEQLVKETLAETRGSEFASFKEVAAEFEVTHCKIQRRAIFIQQGVDGTNTSYSKASITCAYEHMTYDKMVTRGKVTAAENRNFIGDWLRNNPEQRMFQDMGIYPPGRETPDDFLNLWQPFASQLTAEVEIADGVAEGDIALVLKHIRILAGRDEEMFAYVVKWISHVIQHPSEKSTMLVVIARKRCWKRHFGGAVESHVRQT